MIESYYIGVYWGKRKEAVLECAQRVSHLLGCLSRCDPAFGRWFEKGQTREEALLNELNPSQDTLEALLARGANRGDYTGKPLEELGFRLALWTGGKDGEAATLTVKCGCYASAPIFNSCVVGLPSSGAAAQRLLQMPLLTAMVQCLALSWDPDWGVVMSRAFQASAVSTSGMAPQVGWMFYLSSRRGMLPRLDLPFRKIDISDVGALAITTEEKFTVTNSAHVELAQQLADALKRGGYLPQ